MQSSTLPPSSIASSPVLSNLPKGSQAAPAAASNKATSTSSIATASGPQRFPYLFRSVLDFPRRIAHPPTPPVPRVGTVRSFKLTPCYLVSLQDVVAGRHLPPLGRKEFEDFLYFKEYSVENLYFYIWFNQYQAEWTQWAKSVQKEGRSIDSNGTLLAHTNTNTSEDQTHEDEQDEKKKKKSGSNENSTRNGRVSSSSLDDAQPDRHLAMSYLRAKQTFFTPGSRWELNLPQKTLQLLLHPPEGQRHPGPRSHPHPSAFASVRFDVENYLNASLSRFIVQNGGNAGRQRGAFAVIVGLLAIGLGLLPIILTSLPYTPSGPNNPINNNHPNATMSPPHRPWSTRLERLSSIPPLWLGFATLIAGLHGVCVVIFLFGDARQLYPYELKRPSISSPIACAPTLAMNPNLIANGADQRRHQRLHRKRRRGDGDDGRKRLSVGVVAVPGHEQGQGRGAAARGPPHVQGGETFAVERESGREEGRAHFIAHVNLDGRRRRRGGVNAGVDSSATSDANSRTVEGEGEGEEEADVGRQGGYKRQSLYESAEDDEEEEEGEEEDEEEEEDDVFGVGRGKGSSGKARSRSPSRSTSHSVGFELEDHHRHLPLVFDFDSLPLPPGMRVPEWKTTSSKVNSNDVSTTGTLASPSSHYMPHHFGGGFGDIEMEEGGSSRVDLHSVVHSHSRRHEQEVEPQVGTGPKLRRVFCGVGGWSWSWSRDRTVFAPLTKVLDPVVTRTQWEIVMRSSLVALAMSLVVGCGSLALP
ncbi:hypothetical protein FRC14_001321 [Serendipita sp. 396]|nr:hypothetical protein FRC14_001321 [Serendipita sp. 396]